MKKTYVKIKKNMSLIFEESSNDHRGSILTSIYNRFPFVTGSLLENETYFRISRFLEGKIKPVIPVWCLNPGEERSTENVYCYEREISRVNSISLVAVMIWNQNKIRIYLQSGLDFMGCPKKNNLLETIDDAIVHTLREIVTPVIYLEIKK